MAIVKSGVAGDCPVTYNEIKAHLRLIDDVDQSYVNALVALATDVAEEYCNRAIRAQSYIMYLDNCPAEAAVRVPYPPLRSVTHIKYLNESGVLTTLATSEYNVDIINEPGRIILSPTSTGWPLCQYYTPNSFIVTYAAGWATVAEVPEAIKAAIRMMVANYHEHRSEIAEIQNASVSKPWFAVLGVERLLNLYKIPAFGNPIEIYGGSEWQQRLC
jgi:uncharacterized phiE125 gp8 family phage protein